MLGDAVLAEDIAAEALARAYARWPKVSALPYRDGWVLRVAANLAIDHVRRRDPEPVRTALPSPEDDSITLRLAVAACLRALPRRHRQAVALHYLAGLTDGEVAQALGISAGSVKTHIHRGLAALGATLGPDLEEVVPIGLE
jgi:RNA polymerase sigma-70 factor (ECF subfamily)